MMRYGFLLFTVLIGPPLLAQITPSDVYYLARDIDRNLLRIFNHRVANFDKTPLSDNIKPRNVYQKACYIAEEYGVLQPNAISSEKVAELLNRDSSNIGPGDVYGVLSLIQKDLQRRNRWREDEEVTKTSKTPSEVFQMLRKLSLHNLQIARKRDLQVDWASPARVYHLNVTHVMPILRTFGDSSGFKSEAFQFPAEAAADVKPRHIFAFQSTLYREMGEHFKAENGYQPVLFRDYTKMKNIDPGDVFDLTLIVLGELRALMQNATLDQSSAQAYNDWRAAKDKVGPGDVYHLLRYNFFVAVQTLAAIKS